MTEAQEVQADGSDLALPRGPAGVYALLLCAVVPFMMVAITYEVVSRHFFNSAPLWVNDVTGYLQLAVTFLGGAYVMSREGHTRVDILLTHASARAQERLTLLNAVLVLLVSVVIAGAAGFAVVDSYQRNLATVGIIDVPRFVILSPIVIGAVLLSIERLRRIAFLLRRRAAHL